MIRTALLLVVCFVALPARGQVSLTGAGIEVGLYAESGSRLSFSSARVPPSGALSYSLAGYAIDLAVDDALGYPNLTVQYDDGQGLRSYSTPWDGTGVAASFAFDTGYLRVGEPGASPPGADTRWSRVEGLLALLLGVQLWRVFANSSARRSYMF